MYEKEKQRGTHLIILLVYTFLTIALTGESLLLGWEMGAIVLLLLGLVASWVMHITEKIPASIRLWLYFVLTMLAFFFYGIHETSIYDLAPLMIVVIIMYSNTEKYSIIRLCVVCYYLTMGYDVVFVIKGSMEINSLTITRTILHLVLVYMAGYLVKVVLRRRREERINTENKIEELEETNRRAEDFLANVSHELRTPINAVTGITTVMLKSEENAEKRKEIRSIQIAGNRLFGQIEDILDYTEIDTGKVRVSEENYMISSIVNDILTGIRMSGHENMPELIFDVDAGVPAVLCGDERKIKKILKHLIDNALKFTPKGGVYVRVSSLPKPYGINLCIQVRDTGVGIKDEELGRITEQFYQANGGRNRRAGGLGLGLSIVYGMVTAMKGFIQVESNVEKGTTVSVSIPQKVVDSAPNMVISNKENLCIACYIKPEKYKVPEVREYYNMMISNMIQELDIPLHRISNRDELQSLTSMYKITHLFAGVEEYTENKDYFEKVSAITEVIVVADDSFVLPQKSRIRLFRKPFFSLPIIHILSDGASGEIDSSKKKYMICPNISVLVVDDEPMNLSVAEGIFKDYQMIVKTASSGREAIEICKTEDFDLIFLDHMMPEMDGVETLKKLRKIQVDQNKIFTIIAFTANAVSGARDMFMQKGFDEFVSKPVETFELERVLRNMLPKSAIKYVDETYGKGSRDINSENEAKSKPQEDEMEQLKKAGIHIDSAIQYCRGDVDFYKELLTQFVKESVNKEANICDFYEQKDFENYRIQVHSLKSSAKMIGADSLSETAKRLEEAAKNQDITYICEQEEGLLAQYRETIHNISEVLHFDEYATKQITIEISKDELMECLEKLKECLSTYELDMAESLLAKMNGTKCQGTSTDELLCAVKQDVDDFEFDMAVEKVEHLLDMVKRGEM